MEELLSRVLDAHGGLDTWNRVHEAARRGAISPTASSHGKVVLLHAIRIAPQASRERMLACGTRIRWHAWLGRVSRSGSVLLPGKIVRTR